MTPLLRRVHSVDRPSTSPSASMFGSESSEGIQKGGGEKSAGVRWNEGRTSGEGSSGDASPPAAPRGTTPKAMQWGALRGSGGKSSLSASLQTAREEMNAARQLESRERARRQVCSARARADAAAKKERWGEVEDALSDVLDIVNSAIRLNDPSLLTYRSLSLIHI